MRINAKLMVASEEALLLLLVVSSNWARRRQAARLALRTVIMEGGDAFAAPPL